MPDLERRYQSTLELRATDDPNVVRFTGYATSFDQPYEMHGGPPKGWNEIIKRGAFTKTLAEGADVRLLINHDGLPLARTKSGTLHLQQDDHGLRVDAELDARDPDVQRLQYKMQRGDVSEMSFAFRTIRQEWTGDNQENRELSELSLDGGDVSIVTYPANLHGTVAALRSMPDDDALEVLAALPYGDVAYADPGYQKDGKKRYPIDTKAHVQAAWSYINQSDNASQYSPDDLAKVKARIKAAAKKFGITIDDEKKSAATPPGMDDGETEPTSDNSDNADPSGEVPAKPKKKVHPDDSPDRPQQQDTDTDSYIVASRRLRLELLKLSA